MATSLHGEIRQWIQRYLDGEVTLDDFEDWFWPETWHIDRNADPTGAYLADAVSYQLGEFAGGETDEAGLKELLAWRLSREAPASGQ